ncbi:hypothetical protein [Dendronalium sp. ChiSLP03b]
MLGNPSTAVAPHERLALETLPRVLSHRVFLIPIHNSQFAIRN